MILTGLRANNDLHIGNYFGGLLPIVDMAKQSSGQYQINLFVPDLHSFTTPIDHSKLQEQIMNNLRLFVAAGLALDNSDVHIYRQSYISAHSELTWILDCFTGFGEMSRMTQFKDKSGDMSADRTSVGLFNYPVLMAADILLYGATYVPVGDDQTQHLEFTRDIAERMNRKFGQELFTIPVEVKKQHEFFKKDQGLRIKDLQNPAKKMSKSDDSGKGVIFLGDTPEAAAKKVHSAATDSFDKIDIDSQDQPGLENLMQIITLLGDYAAVKGRSFTEVKAHYKGHTQYSELKTDAAILTSEFLHDFQSKLAQVDDSAILSKLAQSEKAMNEQANATLLKVQKAVGLR